ncbi:MAG TPA: DUF222 domain-containing protein [Acidimicrobiales bacterium]|nr:DUF222 domain-containing protein [Acidimicrobiales bacterium]
MDISALPSERLEAEIIQAAAQIQAATYRWLLLVAEFERRGLYAAWGARSTAHCLNFACGISLRTAHDHVRVATRLAELPQVAEAFAGGVISYSKVRAISRIATPESEPALLEAARSASASQLERLVACREAVTRNEAQEVEAKRQFFLHENHDGGYSVSGNLSAEEGALVRAAMAAHKAGLEAAARSEGDASPCSAEHGDASVCSAEHKLPRPGSADVFMSIITTALAAGPTATEDGEPVQVVLHIEESTQACWLESGRAVAPDTARRLSCAATILPMLEREGEPLKVGRATRTPSRAQRRALRRRDGGCRFPGCSMRRYVQAHHISHWQDGGPTDLDNLVLLCSHHHHLVHEGGWAMTGSAKQLEIRKPNGRLLGCCPQPVAATGPTIEEQNEQQGLHITANTSNLLGYTYRPNYDEAIQALLNAERHPVSQ